MITSNTIKKLKPYLSDLDFRKLQIVTVNTESDISKLVVIKTVSDICENYQSTEEVEKIVGKLLLNVVKNLF